MQPVKMYSTATCPYCLRAKALLKQRGVEAIDEIRVDELVRPRNDDDPVHPRSVDPDRGDSGGPRDDRDVVAIKQTVYRTGVNSVLMEALITTLGFRDVLEIGRHVRREVYALNPQQPPTLIPRGCRIGITERIRPDGRVEVPLISAALESLAAALDRIDPVSVAVCLMNSYLNPQHEQEIAGYLAKTRPLLKVSCASALSLSWT